MTSFYSETRLGQLLLRGSGGREIWALADQALVSGVNFLTFALLARSLGVSVFGVFALCWAAVLFGNSLQLALVVSPMISIGPKQDGTALPFYYGAVAAQEFGFVLLNFVCVYGGTKVLAWYFPGWRINGLEWPLAAATAAYLAQDWGRRYFFTINRSGWALASDALGYLPQLPLLWWMAARKELTVARALGVIALTSLIAILVSAFWFEKMRFNRKVIRTVAIRHWKFSRWLAPSAALQWASLNVFMISAPIYYGPAAAGALRACQNIVGIAHIWFLGLENVLPVETARRLHENGLNGALRYLWQTLLRWAFVTGGFMLLIAVAPSFWLHVVYGARYTQFGYVLRLYGVLYLLVFVGGPLRAGLQAFEHTAPVLWSYIAMTVFAAIIAAPLAKRLGLFGVMLGLIATQLLFQVLLAGALIQCALRMRQQEALVLRT